MEEEQLKVKSALLSFMMHLSGRKKTTHLSKKYDMRHWNTVKNVQSAFVTLQLQHHGGIENVPVKQHILLSLRAAPTVP